MRETSHDVIPSKKKNGNFSTNKLEGQNVSQPLTG